VKIVDWRRGRFHDSDQVGGVEALWARRARGASQRPSRSHRARTGKRCARRMPYEIGARAFRPIIDRIGREAGNRAEEEHSSAENSSRAARRRRGRARREYRDCAEQREFPAAPSSSNSQTRLKIPAYDLPRIRSVLAAMEREGRS